MYITNVTDDYTDTLSINNNCTNNENNRDSNTSIYNNPIRNVTHMFDIFDGIYFSQTFNK